MKSTSISIWYVHNKFWSSLAVGNSLTKLDLLFVFKIINFFIISDMKFNPLDFCLHQTMDNMVTFPRPFSNFQLCNYSYNYHKLCMILNCFVLHSRRLVYFSIFLNGVIGIINCPSYLLSVLSFSLSQIAETL